MWTDYVTFTMLRIFLVAIVQNWEVIVTKQFTPCVFWYLYFNGLQHPKSEIVHTFSFNKYNLSWQCQNHDCRIFLFCWKHVTTWGGSILENKTDSINRKYLPVKFAPRSWAVLFPGKEKQLDKGYCHAKDGKDIYPFFKK